MPEMNGIEATRRIVSAHPEVVVFLCSTYDVEDLPPGAADSGASAYVNKERFGAERCASSGRAGIPARSRPPEQQPRPLRPRLLDA